MMMNSLNQLLSLLEDNPVPIPGLILPEAAFIHFKQGNEGLFLQRSHEDWDSPGAWSYQGGSINYGEHPFDAALRECKEEIGVAPSFRLVGKYVSKDGKVVTYLGEVANKDFEIKLNHEHEMYGWSNYSSQLPEPLHPEIYPTLQYFGLVGKEGP